jgi:ArsR family transcriptional regulator, virulence genes transcriptional regulator
VKKDRYSLHAKMCKTFSNPTRLELLDLLGKGELTVSELVEKTGLGQANVSQHLSVMKNAGAVVAERRGSNVHYKIANPKVMKAFGIIREVVGEKLAKSKKLSTVME